jgi:hypothetical protein
VVHNSCTTGLEARICDVPTFAYRPDVDPQREYELPNSLSVNVFTAEEALDALSAVLRGEPVPQPSMTPLHEHIHGLEGASPASAIAAEILHALPKRGTRPTGSGHVSRRIGVRWIFRDPEPEKWREVALRRDLLRSMRRFAAILEAADLKHRVRITSPQPRLLEISPR